MTISKATEDAGSATDSGLDFSFSNANSPKILWVAVVGWMLSQNKYSFGLVQAVKGTKN